MGTAAARWSLFLAAIGGVLATNEFGTKFLEENAAKEGVITLPSGLQYRVLRRGHGDAHPLANSPCECHYEGRTAQNYPDGPKFDSSYDRGDPTTFAPNQVIKGWTEAMQLMVEGDKWEMFIPSDLGYGDRGSPPNIGGGDALIFTMEIMSIKGGTKPASRCDVASLDGCTDREREYVEKMRAKTDEERAQELERLQRISGTSKIKADKASWMLLRAKLLQKMITDGKKDEL